MSERGWRERGARVERKKEVGEKREREREREREGAKERVEGERVEGGCSGREG